MIYYTVVFERGLIRRKGRKVFLSSRSDYFSDTAAYERSISRQVMQEH